MKVLITGDAGFVGRHFRDELLRRGDEVLGCDTEYGEDCRREF